VAATGAIGGYLRPENRLTGGGPLNILLFGADGQVGWELRRSLCILGAVTALGRRDGDLEQPLRPLVEAARPDVIVNAAAYTAVDRAESEPERALRVNGEAVGEMARLAAERGALLVHYSTDYVFDGEKAGAYRESDATAPLSAYGRSKLAGETAIASVAGCRHLVFRTSWVYALRGRNFARTILQRACTQDRLKVVADTAGVPSSAELIADVTAHAIFRLRGRRESPGAAGDPGTAPGGTYHLVPSGSTTWHGYATLLVEAARSAGLPVRVAPQDIEPVPATAFPAPARRPRNSLLDNRRLCEHFGLALPDWKVHVQRFVDELANSGKGI
jgi:dTDP-4-dehydrorhamnose reductase